MPRIKMTLHCRDGISHEAERHVFIWCALMFDEAIHIAVIISGFQGIQHVRIIGPEVVFDERSRSQLQRI